MRLTSNGPSHAEPLFTADAIQAAWRASVARILAAGMRYVEFVMFCMAPM